MILIYYLHFFCLLLYAYMAGYILYKDPKSLLNKTCAILIASFSIWNFVDAFNTIKDITEDTAMLFQNISSIGWIGFASAVLCFSLAFSKKEKLLKNKWFMVLVFLLPIFFVYKQWTNCILIDPVRQAYGWSYTSSNTIWTHLFYAYYISFSLLAIYLIYRYGEKTEKIREKRQTKIIGASIIISLIGGTIFDVILPELGIYSIPPLANVFILIFALGLVYAIAKYRFLTITPAVAAENIISSMEELLIISDDEGNILNINNAVLDTLKYEQKELLGKSVEMLFRSDNLINSLLKKISQGDIIKNFDGKFMTREAKEIPVIFSCSPLKDNEGDIRGIVFIARDITERKQAEEVLRKSETLLREAQSIGKIGSWEFDIGKDTVTWSDETYVLYERDPKLGPPSPDEEAHYYSTEQAKMLKDYAAKAIETGKEFSYDLEAILPSGKIAYFHSVMHPVKDLLGRVVSLFGTVQEITEHILAEENLRKLSDRLHHYFTSSPTIIYSMELNEKEHITTWITENIFRGLGYSIEEVLTNKWWSNNVNPEDLERILPEYEKIFIKNYVNTEYRFLKKDRTEVWIYEEERLLRDKDGNPTEIIGSWTDITERKRAEEKMQESIIESGRSKIAALNLLEDLRTEMQVRNLAEIALIESKNLLEKVNKHEIDIREEERTVISRNIHDQLGQSMTALKMDLSWLQNHKLLQDEADKKMEKMNELIASTIKDIQRISSDLRPGILDDLGLASAIGWYCEEFSNRSGLIIETDIDEVQTEDPNKNITIYRVLQESLTNIIRHAKAENAIIKLSQNNNDIELTILDDGIGIAPEKLTDIKSLGLLGMIERVKQCSGHMQISSPGNHGTEVKILIPI
jgi:PAS domain S-box-containing protein